MKTSFLLLFSTALLIGSSVSSCTFTKEKTPASEQTGPEYTSAYVCPMHCEGSGSDEPGTCPVCNMDYVPNENKQ